MKIKYLLLPALILVTAGCVQNKQTDYSESLQKLATGVNQLQTSINDLGKRIDVLESQGDMKSPAVDMSGWKTQSYSEGGYIFSFKYPSDWVVTTTKSKIDPNAVYSIEPSVARTNCKTVNTEPVCTAGLAIKIYPNPKHLVFADFYKQLFTSGDSITPEIKPTNVLIDGNQAYTFTSINQFDGQSFQESWIQFENGDFMSIGDTGIPENEWSLYKEIVNTFTLK